MEVFKRHCYLFSLFFVGLLGVNFVAENLWPFGGGGGGGGGGGSAIGTAPIAALW